MTPPIRVLAVAGSLRSGSFNRKLLAIAVPALAQHGIEIDLLDLRELPLPVYDGDIEDNDGLPANARAIKQRLAAASGILIASPEYNGSIPGAFKNAIDWASRGDGDVFAGKLAAVMAASPGGLGGTRMLPHLRHVLTVMGVWLMPGQVSVPRAHEAFTEEGALKSEFTAKQVEALMAEFAAELRRRA